MSFAAAETSRTVIIAAADDSLDENGETLFLNLSGASAGASIADPQGVGTIADNDDPPPPPPAANNPPTLTDKSGTQPKCSVRIYDVIVTGADTDLEGDYPLALVEVSGNGFELYSPTQIRFTSATATGIKTGSYVVRDSRGATAGASLRVNVSGGSCGPLSAPPPPPPGGVGS